ncbi:hypothetical protein BU26DRAFT_53920 [Trematosphaeria pertusa]|uniref:Uncharacterized protein n=1 Tax=Trematosphaeria pertusa TaxID=390896 RepID=A0A6A6I992_9PLEO|nr:uncharacterized protein BU26DRAFT_53920 [Trematosphaeria pertusa]KAF2246827.1 hypothetical protein BU26DRAFT_53920 [Trematosphaeria pertusa]
MKVPGSFDIPLSIRAIIIAYRLQIGLGWVEISRKLGVNNTTAQKFYNRVLEQAGTPDLMEMLKYIDSASRTGAPRVVEPGTQDSLQIRADVLKWRDFDRTDAANHTRPKGQHIKPTTVRRVLQDREHVEKDEQHPKRIKRGRQLRKEALTEIHKQQRRAYTHKLEILDGNSLEDVYLLEVVEGKEISHNLIIIGVDEYTVEFGGSGFNRVSYMEGEDLYKHAQETQPSRFSLMQWNAACGQEISLTRPCRIWEPELPELKVDLAEKLLNKQKELNKKMEQQRINARIPGTTEWRHMEKVNKAVQDWNATIPKSQRKGRRQRR